tara:strand:- start:110 stop:835 length:726 start_codon:yes stop_codon:yes gene_type:complete
MENNTKSLLAGMVEWLPGPFRTIVKSFAVRLDKSPIDSIEKAVDFTHSRASYIAQTALFGYLKARMGTRYRVLFEDDVFSQAIRKSAILVFTSCLSDFTIYITSYVARDGDLTPEEATILARQIYAEGLERGLRSVDSADHPDGALQQFQARTDRIIWPNVVTSLEVFEQSASDLIDFAPVIEEFKTLDREIVMNSVRFRWTNVRQQFQKRLDAPAVARDWRMHDRVPPTGGTAESSPSPL